MMSCPLPRAQPVPSFVQPGLGQSPAPDKALQGSGSQGNCSEGGKAQQPRGRDASSAPLSLAEQP